MIKVITNMLAFVHLVASGEAMMLAKRGGLDLAKAYAAIRASSGNSFVHETETQLILSGSYDIGFTMDLACKDLGFALDMGREFGVPLELAGLVEQTFIRARQQLGGGAWSTAVVKLLEDALGEQLRADGFPARLEPRVARRALTATIRKSCLRLSGTCGRRPPMPCTPLAGWCRVIVTTALGSVAALAAAGAIYPVPAVAQAAAPAKLSYGRASGSRWWRCAAWRRRASSGSSSRWTTSPASRPASPSSA